MATPHDESTNFDMTEPSVSSPSHGGAGAGGGGDGKQISKETLIWGTSINVPVTLANIRNFIAHFRLQDEVLAVRACSPPRVRPLPPPRAP
jgi:hypothetical protein